MCTCDDYTQTTSGRKLIMSMGKLENLLLLKTTVGAWVMSTKETMANSYSVSWRTQK
jgi:hypothetical protein